MVDSKVKREAALWIGKTKLEAQRTHERRLLHEIEHEGSNYFPPSTEPYTFRSTALPLL
jgi:hypothetical protein